MRGPHTSSTGSANRGQTGRIRTISAVALCLFTGGVPLVLMPMLWRNQSDLWNPDSRVALKYSFLYHDFLPHRWWYDAGDSRSLSTCHGAHLWCLPNRYEGVEMAEKVAFAAVSVFMVPASSAQISAEALVTVLSMC